ncbi:uncharacterized protein BYT42DRAFT_547887 [Radiomyces spectabilis]|uniref:uncharacterized protein n=1 Tax=Radiomyces spectabilis TaxID=64574 RepID=UPI00222101D5|nr:uncharacterized protein BYT42DRAFT_547887 [Radiomyces spectabilis]KAI8372845.1 hypothetical protein BYT42DRAFT_547887 [Radiomyces spectabilis]
MHKLTLGQLFVQPVIPISFILSFSTLIAFFFYCIRSGRAKNEKQVSWLLTFASSFVCTFASIPYFWRFWYSGWDMRYVQGQTNFDMALVCFFISYLVLDLSLGSLYYKNRITVATGYVHHTLYVIILFWLMRQRSASFFVVNSLLELPTLILAVGSLKQKWRCDFLFAFTFFLLRLVFHGWMIFALKDSHRIDKLWMVAVCMYPLHLYWFYGIIRQQIRVHAKSIKWILGAADGAKHTLEKRPKHNFLDKIMSI